MTEDAQNALRRTMEAHSRVTRFCFICNYVSRIIEPLASRCAKFRFKPLHGDAMNARLTHIAAGEGLTLQPGTLEALAGVAEGDMRKAITSLQSAATLLGPSVSPAAVHAVSCAVPADTVASLLALLRGKNLDKCHAAVYNLVKDGYPAQQLLKQLGDAVLRADSDTISDVQKAHIATRLSEADKSLIDGGDEVLQLQDVAALASRVLQPGGGPALPYSKSYAVRV